MIAASIIQESRNDLIRRKFGEEFWVVVATLHFIVAICALVLRTIGS